MWLGVDLGAVVLLTLVVCRVVLASCMSDKHEVPCDGMMALEPTFYGRDPLHICGYHTTNPQSCLDCPDLTQATSYGPLGCLDPKLRGNAGQDRSCPVPCSFRLIESSPFLVHQHRPRGRPLM